MDRNTNGKHKCPKCKRPVIYTWTPRGNQRVVEDSPDDSRFNNLLVEEVISHPEGPLEPDFREYFCMIFSRQEDRDREAALAKIGQTYLGFSRDHACEQTLTK